MLRMFITLIWLLILLSVLSVISLFLGILSLGKLSNFIATWVGFVMGRAGLAVAGVKIRIKYHGEKPKEPAVYLFNHSSTLDLFIVVSLMLPRVRFIAKKELLFNPFFWVLAKTTGQIMIDRKAIRSTHEQLTKAYQHIRENRMSLAFAPEGTRSRTGKIGPFKPGAFHTAIELGYPIRPIYIDGAYDLCPGKSLITRPGTVTVHIHPPIDTSGWDKKSIREQKEQIRNRYLQWNGESGV